MNKIVMCGLLFTTTTMGNAQEEDLEYKPMQAPIPVEVFGGNNSTMFQMTVSKQITTGSKFGFFNLVNYEIDYDKFTPNSYIIQSLFTYNFSKHFNAGLGASLKVLGGFKPMVSASYSLFNRNIGLLIQPSYELHKDGLVEIFSMFEWHPHNEKKIQPYFRVQALASFKNEHVFSYHNWRAGIQYKMLRVGPGLNVQHAGPSVTTSVNFGGFINILIN